MTHWGNMSNSMWVKCGLQHESDGSRVDLAGGQ